MFDFQSFSSYFHSAVDVTMEVGAQIIVRGLVQGVGFRYFVYEHATKLGLNGFVVNRYDGSVEIISVGDRSLIEELIRYVKAGPRAADVRDVIITWNEPDEGYRRFEIR